MAQARQAVIGDLGPRQAAAFPSTASLGSVVQRKKSKTMPVLPETAADLVEIPEQFQRTHDDVPFCQEVIHFQTTTAPIVTITLVIFYTDAMIQRLANAVEICADGTFKCTPHQFMQLFTLSFVFGAAGAQRLIPAVYVLSTHKRKEAYGRVLLVVHQKITLLRGVGPVFAFPFRTERFKGDFEASFMIALRESLFTTDSNVTFSGCLFHFSQSSYRRIVELGLKVRISLKFL